MTYFDPSIYCKQNLKEGDLNYLEGMEDIFRTVLDNAYDMYQEAYCPGDSMMLDEIKTQIVDCFIEEAKRNLGLTLHEMTVSFIDHYEEDVEEIEKPKTFLYEPGIDLEDDLPFTEPED